MIQEQVRSGDAFGFFAFSAVAQIKHQFLGAGLLQVFYFGGDFLGFAFGESIHMDVAQLRLPSSCRRLEEWSPCHE